MRMYTFLLFKAQPFECWKTSRENLLGVIHRKDMHDQRQRWKGNWNMN